MDDIQTYQCDFLIIGSGIAGLNFALEASQHGTVIIATKKRIMESNTNYAQGGIAAVLDKTDSYEKHLQDTFTSGCGLCEEKAVELLVQQGPKTIENLVSQGVIFDAYQGSYSLGLEGGHSQSRILHVGDYTGSEIERILVNGVRKRGLQVLEYHIAYDLFIFNGVCHGARILDLKKKQLIFVASNITVLTTGGIGQLYKYTSNPAIATGDGIAMAYRAGAELCDLEFVQFHPTTLNRPPSHNFLISETV